MNSAEEEDENAPSQPSYLICFIPPITATTVNPRSWLVMVSASRRAGSEHCMAEQRQYHGS
jgi:hypothetical protein